MRHGQSLDTPERPESSEATKNHHGQNPLGWSVVPVYWPAAANMLAASDGRALKQTNVTLHETCRAAVSDHPGAPAHPKAPDRGCDRSRARDLEADDLP